MANDNEKITLASILKDSNYNLSLFAEKDIKALEAKIKIQKGKPYVVCIIREKEVQLKPEEVVRQLYTVKLINDYGYPKKRIRFEHPVHFGREIKSADIVVFDKDRPTVEYIIVEVKKPKLKDGKEQLKGYCNATGAPIGVWSNGGPITYYNRKDPNFFEDITDIPKADQTLEDILKERFTWRDLIVEDALLNKKMTLKAKIEDMENEVLANAGVDVFEEVFKLIFTKLYDEMKSSKDKSVLDSIVQANLTQLDYNNYETLKKFLTTDASVLKVEKNFRVLELRNTGQTDTQLKEKIQRLFNEAKKKWPGVFPDESKIDLTPSHLSICVSSLQDVKLFNSNLQVIDEAFEYLVNKSSKGEKGQYFTPRHVIDMCVKMLKPQRGEYMIDTASGSCGFTVHTIFQLTGHLFENTEISAEEKDDVLKVFGIDFDEKAVRVARTLNLIAGDGETNVLHLNTLDYGRWNEKVNNPDWRDTYGPGFRRLEALKAERNSNNKREG